MARIPADKEKEPQNHLDLMSRKRILTLEQAKAVGKQLGIKWDKFDLEQFHAGLGVELEHGTANSTTNVTNDDPVKTGKIALAHLNEFPDYYTRLAKMEEEAKRFWNSKKLKKPSRESSASKRQQLRGTRS